MNCQRAFRILIWSKAGVVLALLILQLVPLNAQQKKSAKSNEDRL